MRNFNSSGEALNSILIIRQFTQTVLPEPVVPAIKRCGISSNSVIIAFPDMLLPRASFSFESDFLYCSESRSSFKNTRALSLLGTSTPTVPFPGTGATILIDCAFMARAISSLKAVILLILTPVAG